MFCKKCGSKIGDARFCPRCGADNMMNGQNDIRYDGNITKKGKGILIAAIAGGIVLVVICVLVIVLVQSNKKTDKADTEVKKGIEDSYDDSYDSKNDEDSEAVEKSNIDSVKKAVKNAISDASVDEIPIMQNENEKTAEYIYDCDGGTVSLGDNASSGFASILKNSVKKESPDAVNGKSKIRVIIEGTWMEGYSVQCEYIN